MMKRQNHIRAIQFSTTLAASFALLSACIVVGPEDSATGGSETSGNETETSTTAGPETTTQEPDSTGGPTTSTGEATTEADTDETTEAPPVCGDGLVEGEEVCDDGEDNGLYGHCQLDCSGPGPFCGDGIVDSDDGESCDDGNNTPDDGCELNCTRTLVGISLGSHYCVQTHDGKVKCWGSADDGRLGYGDTESIGDDETPASKGFVPVGGEVTTIDLGEAFGAGITCVTLASGGARCWGSGEFGLGYGNTNNVGDNEWPSSVGDLELGGEATSVSTQVRHTCAVLKPGGAVKCWGTGSSELGIPNSGLTTIGDDETPADIGNVSVGAPATQLALGAAHTCALLESGGVRCWGSNAAGSLGSGDGEAIGDDEHPSSKPVVSLDGKAIQVVAGNVHTCALLEGGHVQCWGASDFGQLGYGNQEMIGDDEKPSSLGYVPVGGPVVQLAAGGVRTCALLESGSVRCWGSGKNGGLGYGNMGPEGKLCGDTPAEHYCHWNAVCCIGDDEPPASAGDVPLGEKAVMVAVSSSGSSACALLENGQVSCWGRHSGYGTGSVSIGDDETPEENPFGYIPLFE